MRTADADGGCGRRMQTVDVDCRRTADKERQKNKKDIENILKNDMKNNKLIMKNNTK